MWWIWTYVAKEICADLDIRFIEGPQATRDERGFLNVRYHLDGVHGNDDYGALIAQEVAGAMAVPDREA